MAEKENPIVDQEPWDPKRENSPHTPVIPVNIKTRIHNTPRVGRAPILVRALRTRRGAVVEALEREKKLRSSANYTTPNRVKCFNPTRPLCSRISHYYTNKCGGRGKRSIQMSWFFLFFCAGQVRASNMWHTGVFLATVVCVWKVLSLRIYGNNQIA